MDMQRLRSQRIPREIRRFVPLVAVPGIDIEADPGFHDPRDQLIRLGRTIRAARKASGLSLETLAYEAEIDYSTMGEIERGRRNATLVKVMRIAGALNKSLADLFAVAEI